MLSLGCTWNAICFKSCSLSGNNGSELIKHSWILLSTHRSENYKITRRKYENITLKPSNGLRKSTRRSLINTYCNTRLRVVSNFDDSGEIHARARGSRGDASRGEAPKCEREKRGGVGVCDVTSGPLKALEGFLLLIYYVNLPSTLRMSARIVVLNSASENLTSNFALHFLAS